MTKTMKTKYTSNESGKSVIIAKGGGKQRTTAYNPALSIDRNHGEAAGNLALVLGWSASDQFAHLVNDDQTHTFSRL